jgi:hypothetical protein
VRVVIEFRPADLEDGFLTRAAGILLTTGKTQVMLKRGGGVFGRKPEEKVCLTQIEGGGCARFVCHAGGPPLEEPAYLRLERRGNTLTMQYSQDGKKWIRLLDKKGPDLPRTVKVGVMSENLLSRPFKAVFDQFKLTPLGGKAKAR